MRRRPFLLGLLALLSSASRRGRGAGGRRGQAAPVPDAIAVSGPYKVVLDVTGKGAQVYDCTAGAWTLREPAAVLYGRGHRPVGIHFAFHAFESRRQRGRGARRRSGRAG